MAQSTLYAVILTDKAGIEFVRFGTSTHFELRKRQHLSGLKTGFYFANGEKIDYRFFHSEKKLRRLSKRNKNKCLARCAIRNKIIKRARQGEFKIEVRALHVDIFEIIGLLERVLIHAFSHSPRLLNHYSDVGGTTAGVNYSCPSSSAVKFKVRKLSISIINTFDITPCIKERAVELIDSWHLVCEKNANLVNPCQKTLAKENTKSCKKKLLVQYFGVSVQLGRRVAKEKPTTAPNRPNSTKSPLPYPRVLEIKKEIHSIEFQMKYFSDQASMHNEDYLDLGGDEYVAWLQQSGQYHDLLQDLLERKADRDALYSTIASLQKKVQAFQAELDGASIR